MLERKTHFLFFALFSALPMIIGSALMGPYVYSSFFLGGVLFFLFSCFWGLSGLILALGAGSLFLFPSDYRLFFETRSLLFLFLSLISSFLAVALERRLVQRDQDFLLERKQLEEKIQALSARLSGRVKEGKQAQGSPRKKKGKGGQSQLEFW